MVITQGVSSQTRLMPWAEEFLSLQDRRVRWRRRKRG
jgi:hypothetical protein